MTTADEFVGLLTGWSWKRPAANAFAKPGAKLSQRPDSHVSPRILSHYLSLSRSILIHPNAVSRSSLCSEHQAGSTDVRLKDHEDT